VGIAIVDLRGAFATSVAFERSGVGVKVADGAT